MVKRYSSLVSELNLDLETTANKYRPCFMSSDDFKAQALLSSEMKTWCHD